MQERYRRDYTGEFVVTNTNWRLGSKNQQREWIPNVIENSHISKRAAVIGSDVDVESFDYSRLIRHRGGLLGKKKLQTYGSGDCWKRLRFDFFVTTDRSPLSKIHENRYCDNSVVYTNSRLCLQYPGDFYLIPYQPPLCDLALSVYLPAFDGHEEVFLLGFNNETPPPVANWTAQVNEVFSTYPGTIFYLVGTASNMPDSWRSNRNVKCIDYRNFVTYCDV